MFSEIAMYLLSALVLGLGAIALFRQKVFQVDKESGVEYEIELPLIGKLRSNYPALAFAFIGAFMAVFTFNRMYEVKEQWVIYGKFKAPDSRVIDWSKGDLTLMPKQIESWIKPDGSFYIQLSLPKAITFEDYAQCISYYNWSAKASAEILVGEEYNKFKSGSPTVLQTVEGRTRRYGPVQVNMIPKPAS